MAAPAYPLAPSALGQARAYDVAGLSQGRAWSYAAVTDLLPVSLAPNPATGGWYVRTRHGALGTLDAGTRGEYPELDRVLRSGWQPATVAEFSLADDRSGLLSLDILLPAPPFLLPRNNLPAEARLLPQGDPVLVDTSATDGVGAAEVAAISPAQLLVTLTTVSDRVVAVYDNRPVGTLPADRLPPRFAEQVGELHRAGTPLAARAFCGDSLVAVDLAADLVDAAQPLPALAEPAPQPHRPADPGADWDVFVDAPEITVTPPKGARPLRGPAENDHRLPSEED